MANNGPPDDPLRRIAARLEALENAFIDLPSLKSAVQGSEKRMSDLLARNDDTARSVRELGDMHMRALAQFTEMLNRQHDEHRQMLTEQDERWRGSLRSMEQQYLESQERIVQETISRVTGFLVRGTFETLARWLWPGLLAVGIAVGGWFYHQLTSH
jgi:NAD-dependent DNA ligase